MRRGRRPSYNRTMADRYARDFKGGPDSDGDGLSDAFELVVLGTDPRKRDTDGDGLNDLREKDFGSDPNAFDTDGDGMGDGREVTVGTAPFMPDTDGDGVGDRAETIAGTAHAPDEDGDGTADWVQSVRDADVDGDGIGDGEEQWLGTNILSPNSDGDDLDDLEETMFGTELGRSPSVFDGAPSIQVPSTPENPQITPDLDLSPPGTNPQAALEPEAAETAEASEGAAGVAGAEAFAEAAPIVADDAPFGAEATVGDDVVDEPADVDLGSDDAFA